MSFAFEAVPKVVTGKPKFRNQPEKAELEYITETREKLKVHNMQTQLKLFKDAKKISPYDIKPLPNPKISVNLDFFLIDNNDIPPKKADAETQIDSFLPPPQPKPFVPMKTGIDTMTQVEDYELFEFDREVLPIVRIISTKTLEQSLLELSEEEELDALALFKENFRMRMENEGERNSRKVQEEMKRVQYKNETVWSVKDLEKMKAETCYRMIGYSIGQKYLENLFPNTILQLNNLGYYQDSFQTSLSLELIPWLVSNTAAIVNEKISIGGNIDSTANKMQLKECFQASRKKADERIALVLEEQRVRRVNFSESHERRARLVIKEDTPLIKSLLAREMQKFSEGTFEDFDSKVDQRVAALQSLNFYSASIETGEMLEEEALKVLREELVDDDQTPYSANLVSNVSVIAFTMANDLFYRKQTSGGKASQFVFLYDSERNLVGTISHETSGDFFEFKNDIRDRKLPYSSDSALIIDFKKLPDNVEFVLFTLETNLPAQAFDEAVSTLCDWNYLYTLASVNLQKFNDLPKPDINEDTPLYSVSLLLFAATRKKNQAWKIESFGHSKIFEQVKRKEHFADIENYLKFYKGKKSYLRRLSDSQDPENEGNSVSRIFKLNLGKSEQGFLSKVHKILKDEFPRFLEKAVYSYTILINGRKFNSVKQLRKLRRLGQISIQANPPPPEEHLVEEGGGEKLEEEENE